MNEEAWQMQQEAAFPTEEDDPRVDELEQALVRITTARTLAEAMEIAERVLDD